MKRLAAGSETNDVAMVGKVKHYCQHCVLRQGCQHPWQLGLWQQFGSQLPIGRAQPPGLPKVVCTYGQKRWVASCHSVDRGSCTRRSRRGFERRRRLLPRRGSQQSTKSIHVSGRERLHHHGIHGAEATWRWSGEQRACRMDGYFLRSEDGRPFEELPPAGQQLNRAKTFKPRCAPSFARRHEQVSCIEASFLWALIRALAETTARGGDATPLPCDAPIDRQPRDRGSQAAHLRGSTSPSTPTRAGRSTRQAWG